MGARAFWSQRDGESGGKDEGEQLRQRVGASWGERWATVDDERRGGS